MLPIHSAIKPATAQPIGPAALPSFAAIDPTAAVISPASFQTPRPITGSQHFFV